MSESTTIGADLLRKYIKRAIDVCTSFPDLQDTPTPRLGLSSFIPSAIAAKSAFLEELTTLRTALAKLAQRIDLPMVIGLVGKFSSGKSSLLNSFFHAIFQGPPPPSVMRDVANTPVDERFTYITHARFSQRFQPTPEIDIVPLNHEFFRNINFIDTPGTGWKAFTVREVADLVSSADVMLFLFKPTEILDRISVEALSIKFSLFEHIPIWYVLTHASDYAEQPGDWRTINTAHVITDLKVAHQKLESDEGIDAEDRKTRDLVARRVQFDFGVNTFLVDAKYQHGTKELLQRLSETFGGDRARQDKDSQLDRELQLKREQLGDVLERAKSHMQRLAEVLHSACTTVITSDLARFVSTTVASEAALLSHTMYAQLRQEPLAADSPWSFPQSIIPVTYSYEQPEVSNLRLRLDDLRQDRDYYVRGQDAADLLFKEDAVTISIDRARHEVGRALRKELDRTWTNVLPSLLGGQKRSWKLSDDSTEQVTEALDRTREYTNEIVDETSKRTIKSVEEKLERSFGALMVLYRDPDIAKTIFGRQYLLLHQMELDVPASYAEAVQDVSTMARRADTYVTTHAYGFRTTVDKRIHRLATSTFQYVETHVFLPTKEALVFLLRDHAQNTDIHESPTPSVARVVEAVVKTLDSDGLVDRAKKEIATKEQSVIGELDQCLQIWKREWSQLDSDYKVMITNAQNVADKLNLKASGLSDRLDEIRRHGLQELTNRFQEIHAGTRKVLERHNEVISDALQEAKRRGKWKKAIEFAVLLIGLGTGLLRLYQFYQPPSSPGTNIVGSAPIAARMADPNSVLKALSCSEPVLSRGQQALCTIQVSEASTAQSVVVRIKTDMPGLSAPSTVTLQAGSDSAVFTTRALATKATIPVTLSATFGTTVQTTVINVIRTGRSLYRGPVVRNLSCSDSSVPRGQQTSCSVELTQNAPPGGLRVAISANSEGLEYPPAVNVVGFSSSGRFTAVASQVRASKAVTLSASLDSSVRTTVVNVLAPNLRTIVCGTSLSAGQQTSCTVQVDAVADGNTVVTLKASALGLKLPASIHVPTGSTSTTFTVSASEVSEPTPITIEAALGESIRAFAITVTPPIVLVSDRTVTITVVGVAFLLAAWMMNKLLLYRATFDRVIEGVYKERRDECLGKVDAEFEQARKTISGQFATVNRNFAAVIRGVCDDAVKACDLANKQILPKLDEQVKVAAKLAVETTKQIATTKQVSMGQIMSSATTPLYEAAQAMDDNVRQHFDRVIKDATDDAITRIEGYTDRFRQTSKEIAKIRVEMLHEDRGIGTSAD